jgi:hypothetical protein
VDSSPDAREWDPTARHFVACGVLPVGLMLARFGSVFPLNAIDYSRFEVVQEPILFGFLFALTLCGLTNIEYRRCLRASLVLAAGYLFCFLLKDQFVDGWPLRAVTSNSYPTFLMRVFILLFTGAGFFFAIGFSRGDWGEFGLLDEWHRLVGSASAFECLVGRGLGWP